MQKYHLHRATRQAEVQIKSSKMYKTLHKEVLSSSIKSRLVLHMHHEYKIHLEIQGDS